MLTQLVAGRVYDFSHAVGRWGAGAPGFSCPIKPVIGKDNTVYVLCRGYEIVPIAAWNKIAVGVKISKVSIGNEPGDEELQKEIGKYGDTPGDLIWPAGITLDIDDNLYITDEWMNRITILDPDGKFKGVWGTSGKGDGQFNGPSGIASNPNGDLYVVDSMNHRVQKFTRDGRYLGKFGSYGNGMGQLNSPWGITVDKNGFVYVADHKNNRIQKFDSYGTFVQTFGVGGDSKGSLNRPTDVTVDGDGDVYVADWLNDRVQLFAEDGHFLTSFVGDAQVLSKWGSMVVVSNPDSVKRRREVGSLKVEWEMSMPTGVTFDHQKNRLLVADTQRHRLQIYKKVTGYMEPQRNL